FDRQGKRIGTVGEPGPYDSMCLSPDEKRLLSCEQLLQLPLISGFMNLLVVAVLPGLPSVTSILLRCGRRTGATSHSSRFVRAMRPSIKRSRVAPAKRSSSCNPNRRTSPSWIGHTMEDSLFMKASI